MQLSKTAWMRFTFWRREGRDDLLEARVAAQRVPHRGKAFVDIGNAPADQSNRRTHLQDYSAGEIYPVLQGPSEMMIRNNALWKR
jgi:hypothetical protein